MFANNPLALTEDNTVPQGKNLIATNHSSQKSIKEPAKKHFTSNYITQIVPDSTHMFTTAIYLQYNDMPSLQALQY